MKTEITSDDVREAMIAADIYKVDHHACSICETVVYYFRVDNDLFFDPSCGCTYYSEGSSARDWQDAADWINMQSGEPQKELAARFGLVL